MTNGFYNTDNFSATEIKKFVKDAIKLAYDVNCQTIVGTQRQITKTLYINKYILDAINNNPTLYIVDRFTHSKGAFKKELCDYEICLAYNSNFLYIFVNEENFNKLIKKYNLKPKEW